VTCLAPPGARGDDRMTRLLLTTEHNHPHRWRVRGRLRSASTVAVGVAVRWQLASPPFRGFRSSHSSRASVATLIPEAFSLSPRRSTACSPLTSRSFLSSLHSSKLALGSSLSDSRQAQFLSYPLSRFVLCSQSPMPECPSLHIPRVPPFCELMYSFSNVDSLSLLPLPFCHSLRSATDR